MRDYRDQIINKRVLILHNYPTEYLIRSLISTKCRLVIVGKISTKYYSNDVKYIDLDIFNEKILLNELKKYHILNPIDCILPVWEGSVILSAKLAKDLNLNGNPIEAVVNARNKYLSSLALSKFAVPHPSSQIIKLTHKDIDIRSLNISYPAIIKLPNSTNSQSVIKVNNLNELSAAIAKISNIYNLKKEQGNRLYSLYGDTDSKEALIQEYITGIELNIDLIYANNEFLITGIFEKSPMEGPYFAEVQSVYPPSLSEQQLLECITIAKKSVIALGGKVGAAHVELRFSKLGPIIIETALRPGGFYTALVIEKLLDQNLYALLVYTMIYNRLTDLIQQAYIRTMKAYLYGAVNFYKKGIINALTGVEILNSMDGIVDSAILKKPGDIIIPLPEGSDYHIAQFVLEGDSRQDVIKQAEIIRDNIKVEIRDIA